MSNKNEDLLALGPIEEFAITSAGDLVLNGRAFTRNDLAKIVKEAEKQNAAIKAIYVKTHHGLIKMAEIDQEGYVIFYDTADYILGKRDRARRGTELWNKVEAFADRSIVESANATLQAQRIGKTGILKVIHETPYPPESEHKEPLSLWERVFGHD